ncbi:MAG: imidazole glycerol phosphate synthase subunit HisF, partial [Proteocatella sp.]
MKDIRVIAKLDVKPPYLVKGIQLEGLRKIGNPNDFAKKYYLQGIDEIIYVDIVASLYERNSLSDMIREATKDIFIPITAGGGIRSVNDAYELLRAGADKIAVNTAAVKNPQLIRDLAMEFGSQCVVSYIEAKKTSLNNWEVYYDNGREKTGKSVVEWADQVCDLGAGEILLTSVDKDGTGKGFDVELVEAVASK